MRADASAEGLVFCSCLRIDASGEAHLEFILKLGRCWHGDPRSGGYLRAISQIFPTEVDIGPRDHALEVNER